ncbi:MAG: hypothetical protein K0R43_2693 [Pseudoduganella sp.]|jgi:hypothetical protein|nr:hypothetical protein [Pseudoduganella sp.]
MRRARRSLRRLHERSDRQGESVFESISGHGQKRAFLRSGGLRYDIGLPGE